MESILDVMGVELPPGRDAHAGLALPVQGRTAHRVFQRPPNLYNWALTTFPVSVAGSASRTWRSFSAGPHRPGGLVRNEVLRVAGLVAEHARTRPAVSLGVSPWGSSTPTASGSPPAGPGGPRAARRIPLRSASARAGKERFFVKNLERVQGDERDATS